VLIGADGSGGVTSRRVGATFEQVDVGLEVELPAGDALAERWQGRIHIDWGPLPGSYGWVFPKGDRLTVGVIGDRADGARLRAYLKKLVTDLGLDGLEPVHDSGHLTRCRADGSPLGAGRVLLAGDAAGLLEPWTREGISYALSSGVFAGVAATRDDPVAHYTASIHKELVPHMVAGRRLLQTFRRNPAPFHAAMATPPGWRAFTRMCRGELTLAEAVRRPSVRAALKVLELPGLQARRPRSTGNGSTGSDGDIL
jgi:flavin-dependent dehydrogenase